MLINFSSIKLRVDVMHLHEHVRKRAAEDLKGTPNIRVKCSGRTSRDPVLDGVPINHAAFGPTFFSFLSLLLLVVVWAREPHSPSSESICEAKEQIRERRG